MALSSLAFVASVEHIKKTYWDFYFSDNIFFKFRIKSMTLPFPQFEVENRNTWENFYKELKLETKFEIEIYEDLAFSTYNYFKAWQDQIYDMKTRKFISYPNVVDPPYIKSGIFSYYPTGGLVESTPSKSFQLDNVKLIGIGDITNDYEDGSALIYTVSLAFEGIKEI